MFLDAFTRTASASTMVSRVKQRDEQRCWMHDKDYLPDYE